jgi:hypothetical protein
MDVQTLGMIAGVVAVVAFVLYVWDRRNRKEAVSWVDAAKITLGAGTIAGGVSYAVGTDAVSDIAETVSTATQDMFVGKPEF